MIVAQRVNDWISNDAPKPVCDICIVEGLGLSQQAHAAQITAALGTTSDFVRIKGVCSLCKNDRMVIKAS